MYVVFFFFFFEIKTTIDGSFLRTAVFVLIRCIRNENDEANCYWLFGYINNIIETCCFLFNIDNDVEKKMNIVRN